MSRAIPEEEEPPRWDGPAIALLDEKLGVVEKTGCEPVAASRFSQVTDVNVSSSASIFASDLCQTD